MGWSIIKKTKTIIKIKKERTKENRKKRNEEKRKKGTSKRSNSFPDFMRSRCLVRRNEILRRKRRKRIEERTKSDADAFPLARKSI